MKTCINLMRFQEVQKEFSLTVWKRNSSSLLIFSPFGFSYFFDFKIMKCEGNWESLGKKKNELCWRVIVRSMHKVHNIYCNQSWWPWNRSVPMRVWIAREYCSWLRPCRKKLAPLCVFHFWETFLLEFGLK